jgi:hypothetical protein
MWILALSLAAGGASLAKELPHDMTGKREQRMKQCPSAVPGATTKVVDRKDGVEVTVTAPSATSAEEIRNRARHQEAVSLQPARGAIEHTGEGTGSGKLGYCPGMIQATQVTAEDVPDGARLIIRAADPDQVKKLQKTAHERAQALRVRQ